MLFQTGEFIYTGMVSRDLDVPWFCALAAKWKGND